MKICGTLDPSNHACCLHPKFLKSSFLVLDLPGETWKYYAIRMPSLNVVKEYREDSYYHLYNRGVNKENIFNDDQDYKVFLSYLKEYVSQVVESSSPSKIKNNFANDISINAYCLMPNHFHLLVHQKNSNAINYFMRSINTRYVRYFNTKYQRIGPLYQGTYKAVLVSSDEQLLYLTKYIHRNPLKLYPSRRDLEVVINYPYSSFKNYTGKMYQTWIMPDDILAHFSEGSPAEKYQLFVVDSDDTDVISGITIDE